MSHDSTNRPAPDQQPDSTARSRPGSRRWLIGGGAVVALLAGLGLAFVLGGGDGSLDTGPARDRFEQLIDDGAPLEECPLGESDEALFARIADELDEPLTDEIAASNFTRSEIGVRGDAEVLTCTIYGDGPGDPRIGIDVMAAPDGAFAEYIERTFVRIEQTTGTSIDVEISSAGEDEGGQLTHISLAGTDDRNTASVAAWSDDELAFTISVEAPGDVPDPSAIESALLVVLPSMVDSLSDY